MCGTTNSRKVGELLDILLTKTEKDYEVFCYLLSEHGMKHFVTHYFSDRGNTSLEMITSVWLISSTCFNNTLYLNLK